MCGDTIFEWQKKTCDRLIALNINNDAPCSRIFTENERYLCYKQIAIRNSDPEICRNIKDANLSEECRTLSTHRDEVIY
jgi:hypothetical protein